MAFAPHGFDVPGELIDAIIGCLPDHQAIGICALTCRAFVPWSQRYLFNEVRLHERNFLQFLLLLQSPHCAFPSYVHRLYISPQVSELVAFKFTYHVTLLDVIRRQHTWLDHKHKDSFFHRDDLWKSGNVVNLVSLFPALQHLQLTLSGFASKVIQCDRLPLVSSTMKSLALICHHRSPLTTSHEWKHFMEWVLRQRICSINTLSIMEMVSMDIEGVEILLKLQGSSVRHLHVLPLTHCVPLNLTHNPHLESVQYRILRAGINQIATEMFSGGRIPPSNDITTLVFDTKRRLLDNHHDELQHLRHLDTILVSEMFLRLSTILVRIEYPPDDMQNFLYSRDSANILYDVFPLARARGILQVEHCAAGEVEYYAAWEVNDDWSDRAVDLRRP